MRTPVTAIVEARTTGRGALEGPTFPCPPSRPRRPPPRQSRCQGKVNGSRLPRKHA